MAMQLPVFSMDTKKVSILHINTPSISRVLIIHCQLFPELIQLPNVKHFFATLLERVLDIGKRIASK